jgi:hypothetical protein
MAYNPAEDWHPSPTQMGELYAATCEWAMSTGAFTLGNPSDPPPANPDKIDSTQTLFFGLPVMSDGAMLGVAEYPLMAYPPTWKAEFTDLEALHEQIPDLTDVLGVNGTLQVVHHAPYFSFRGGMAKTTFEAKAVTPDCAFIIDHPKTPGLRKRVYKITPSSDRPDYARGSRTDLHAQQGIIREETGLLPDMAYTEWERLMRVVQSAGMLFTHDHPLLAED